MADPRIRTFYIKTGVVKRLTKEKSLYEKEAEKQKEKLASYRDQGKDEYEIRKQEELLRESLMMISDCQRRLLTAHEDLKTLVDNEVDLKEIAEYGAAQTALVEASVQLNIEQ